MAEIEVEVVYAEPQRQWLLSLRVPAGSTVAAAVAAFRAAADAPALPVQLDLGVYARAVEPEHILREGDRVEIYRPLKIDPKAARRRRAEQSPRKR